MFACVGFLMPLEDYAQLFLAQATSLLSKEVGSAEIPPTDQERSSGEVAMCFLFS